MAGGPNVGRVSVEVIPDTSLFRRELEAQLKRAVRDVTADIKARVDDRELGRSLRDSVRKSDETVTVTVDVNERLVNDALRGLREKIANVPLDTELREGWREELQAEIDAAKALSLDADLAAEGVRQHLAAVLAELQVAAALNPVEIPVQLDYKLGGALLGGLGGLAEIPQSALGGLGRLAPMMLAGVAAATLLAPALALVTGALTAVPAAVGAFAAPVGAVALGLDGIKTAAAEAGLVVLKTSKDGKLEFDKVGESLAGLKTAVSDTFARALVPALTKVNDALPQLTGSFETLAAGMSTAFGGVVDSLTSDKGIGNLQKFINNIGVAFDKAAPGLERFTDGILGLAGKVSERFPDMAESFSNLGKKFGDWFDKANADGSLDRMLDNMRTAVAEIGGLAGDLLTKGFEWMSDPNFGASITTFLGDIRTFVTSTLPGLATGFQQAVTAINDIAPALNQLGGALEKASQLADIMNTLNKLNPANWKGMQALWDMNPFDGTEPRKYTAASTGWWDQLKGYFGFGPDLPPEAERDFKAQAAKIAAAQKSELQDALVNNTKVGGGAGDSGVGQVIGGQVDTAISEATNKLTEFQRTFGGMVDTALEPLKGIGAKIGEAFGNSAAAVSASFGPIVQTVVTGANQIAVALSSTLVNLPQIVRGAFSGLAAAASGAFAPVVATVVQGAQQILVAVGSNLAQLPGIVNTAFSGMTAAIQGQMALAVQTVTSAMGQIVAAVGAAAGGMFAAGASIGSALAAGIRSTIGLVSAAAGDLMAAAHKPIPNSPADEGPFSGKGWVLYSGQSVGEAFAQGLTNSTPQVVDAATQMMQKTADQIADKQKDIQKNADDLAKSIAAAEQGSIKFGGIGVGITTGGLTDQRNELQVQQDRLDVLKSQLELQRLQTADQGAKDAIQARLTELGVQRKQLDVQKEQLDTASQYGAQQSDIASAVDDVFNTMTSIPKDFAQATMGQFMSDVGIEGGGLVTSLMDYGMQLGSSFIFNVSGIGDAISAQQVIQRKEAAVRY